MLTFTTQIIFNALLEASKEPDGCLMLALPHGISAQARGDLIDHHADVVAELRAHGHVVQVLTGRAGNGEVLAIALADDDPS